MVSSSRERENLERYAEALHECDPELYDKWLDEMDRVGVELGDTFHATAALFRVELIEEGVLT